MIDRTDRILAAWHRELPEALTPTSELGKRVLDLGRALTAAILAALAPLELAMSEYDVLAALRRVGDPYQLSPTDLASELILSSGGVTKTLHALDARGLIERRPDPFDKRRNHVQLTPTGVEFAERAVLASTAAQHRVFEPVTRKSAASATEALRQVAMERANSNDGLSATMSGG